MDDVVRSSNLHLKMLSLTCGDFSSFSLSGSLHVFVHRSRKAMYERCGALHHTREMFDVQCHRGIQELVSSNSIVPGYMCASDANSGYMRALYVRQNPVSNSALMLFDEMTKCVSPAVSLLNILPATAPMDDSLLRKEAHDFSVGTGSVVVPFMTTDSFVWTNMCKFTTNAGLGPPLEYVAGVSYDTGWYATNQFNVDVVFGNRMKQYEYLTHDSYIAIAIFVPFYVGFAFILVVVFRMEQLDWSSSSCLAKSLGTIVSIDGAFILTLYKGPALLMGLSPENSSQQSVPSQNSNWILGGLFLVVNCVMVVVFQVECELQEKEDDGQPDFVQDRQDKSDENFVSSLTKELTDLKDLQGHLDCITELGIRGSYLFRSTFDKTIRIEESACVDCKATLQETTQLIDEKLATDGKALKASSNVADLEIDDDFLYFLADVDTYLMLLTISSYAFCHLKDCRICIEMVLIQQYLKRIHPAAHHI